MYKHKNIVKSSARYLTIFFYIGAKVFEVVLFVIVRLFLIYLFEFQHNFVAERNNFNWIWVWKEWRNNKLLSCFYHNNGWNITGNIIFITTCSIRTKCLLINKKAWNKVSLAILLLVIFTKCETRKENSFCFEKMTSKSFYLLESF